MPMSQFFDSVDWDKFNQMQRKEMDAANSSQKSGRMAAGAKRLKTKKTHSHGVVANVSMDADDDVFEASVGDDAGDEWA